MAIIGPLTMLLACDPAPGSFDPRPIHDAMSGQQQAWDRGDIPGFMMAYSDTVCFIGRTRTTCGKDKVTAQYRRSYPDRAAMGMLRFELDEVLPVGDKHAWVTGGWRLYRAADTLGGGFSLLWAREHQGWRIVRDHTY
ncbi:MAG: nuclear transport factor 2 family protein [Flavobacteriales bacterium]